MARSKPRSRPKLKAAARKKPKRASPARPVDQRIPIVGIGASAGGLVALQEFFRTVPPNAPSAFIVVQHLDPTRASEMATILSHVTSLPVIQAADGMELRSGHVFTIPPDKTLTIEDGRLRVLPSDQPRGKWLVIDRLFCSMAEQAGERSVGVVLSGTGSDGTLGLRAIKGEGGLAIAQDPDSAEYDSMPRSAIATGMVDHVLTPGRMMKAIGGFVDHDYVKQPNNGDPIRVPSHINSILSLLHLKRNVDFSGYKKGTLIRRIERRMSMRQVSRTADYLKLLRQEPDEVNALFNDLLIQVTRFFRDADAYKALGREVLSRLVQSAGKESPIRVWVPGCATGEEAYSLAIQILNLADRAQKSVSLQVFASDLDKPSLDWARAGTYPESIANDIAPDLLERYFVRQEHQYVVSQMLRDSVLFAQHNLLVDPPFSRLDLISCRNLLIYLEANIQRRVLQLFHFSLEPGRFLFLGTSETVGVRSDLFQQVNKKAQIYCRLGTVRGERTRLSSAGVAPSPATATVARPRPALPPEPPDYALKHARDLILERHTRATALVNQRFEILSLYGPTGDFLVQPTGPLTTDILSWVREGVRAKLRVALQAAIRKQEKVTVTGMRMRRKDRAVAITVTVEPLGVQFESNGLMLVVFTDQVAPARSRASTGGDHSDQPLVRQLEYELKKARDDLQTTAEQMESTNEELRATNEEVLSINEELQSTNEELENSKEELQSVNEELSTVNAELEYKVGELQTLNDDITNLLTSTDLPTLFLDRGFRIRRFTPATSRLFRLIDSDVGRPISDISHIMADRELMNDIRSVLSSLQPIEREIYTIKSDGFLRRVLPYRTQKDQIEGVVITYTDLADRIRAATQVKEARDFAEAVIKTLREPLLVLNDDLVVQSANAAFYRVFELEPGQVTGRRVFDVGAHEWNIPELRQLLEKAVSTHEAIINYEIRREFAGVGERVLCVNANVLINDSETTILLAFEDITIRLEAERTRTEALRKLVTYDEKERHRLALELHDETGQHLTAFLLGLASLRDTYANLPDVQQVVRELHDKAEELARNLHGISLQLRPRALDDHGLEQAVLNYLEDIRHRHGLEVDFHRAGPELGRLPPVIETVLYRVTQEALTNVLKHARARRVSVVITRRRKEVHLIIEDDGGGFDPTIMEGNGKSLGLRGMRERVMLAKGSLTVESRPGAGTTVFARLPIRGDDYDGDDEA
jgi:two-component system CheB/CheR fusion protein